MTNAHDTFRLSRRALFWLLVLAALLVFVSHTRTALVPFVTAMLLAYLLNPLVNRLQAFHLPRWLGTLLVMLGLTLLVVGMISLVVPLLQVQLLELVRAIPQYADALRGHAMEALKSAQDYLPPETLENLQASAQEQGSVIVQKLGGLVQGILSGGLQAISVLSFIFLTPVLLFYFLRDWNGMVAAVQSLYPRDYHDVITAQMQEIDRTIAGFIRGQFLVGIILGGFYAIALSIAGLDFGFLIGMASGILSFIPYVGTITGAVASLGVALAQYGWQDWQSIAIIGGIYAFGQFVEGNVLSPKLVGSRVNLHPLWIIFALFVGGTLYGFLGVLLAVPVAASLGVLVRFAIGHYRQSSYYRATTPVRPEGSIDGTAAP